MRIVSGKYRGRRLHPPVNLPVRPTTDFAKEGLFNILNNIIDYSELSVLDLFTGTGSIAFEFLSREVSHVTAVDLNPKCVDFITKMAAVLGDANIRAVRSNVFQFLKHAPGPFGLVFADPPYDMEGIDTLPDLITGSGVLAPGGLFILEHSVKYKFTEHPCFDQQRNYGSVNFSFFSEKQLKIKD